MATGMGRRGMERSQSFLSTDHRSISAMGRSIVTFFGIKKNFVAQGFCGHVPHCPTFSKNFTPSSRFSLEVQQDTWVKHVTTKTSCGHLSPRHHLQISFFHLWQNLPRGTLPRFILRRLHLGVALPIATSVCIFLRLCSTL